jgi:hypothetical protein
MTPPEPFEDVALPYLADLQHRRRQGDPDMTTTLDPGRSTRQVPPHPGDVAAQQIRAAMARVQAHSPTEPAEPTPEPLNVFGEPVEVPQ